VAHRSFAAVDLGAESGRVVLGRLAEDGLHLDELHRFANRPLRTPTGLHWDIDALLAEVLTGLRRAVAAGRVDGVGVDAWGVDYALLDANGKPAGPPFHYRDSRTAGAVERTHARVPRADLYAATGIQTMPINTVYQLAAEPPGALAGAARLALIPDLMAHRLSGRLVNERTVASTTGLLDARTGEWASALIRRLGLPAHLFAGDLVEPGVTLGPTLAAHDGCAGVPVHVVAGHDTASAFVPLPLDDDRAAVLVSGTWSLLGVECSGPVLGEAALAANVTNERGAGGRIRLLRNVMGLWLVQECRRAWAAAGAPLPYAELLHAAGTATGEAALVDPDDQRFLAPGDMPARIAAACRESRQPEPDGPAQTLRTVLASLACKYRLVLEELEAVTRRRIERLHVVGGGARNALLRQLTADVTGRPVIAGPVEASAAGNVLVQAAATGELGSLADMRALAQRSFPTTVAEPGDDRDAADELYHRFLAVTGLREAVA
jgi:rhamnulokinase